VDNQTHFKSGDRIGDRFLVHQALAGGMGEVYLCLDLQTVQPAALKTFQRRFLTHAQVRQRFEQEAYTWVSLEKHPHIVRCYHMELIANLPFLLLEWVVGEEDRGTDLRSWLRRGALPPKQALQFAIDICRGLTHAATKVPGLVHRDLKPENVLVAQGGIAKITDFGLAKLVQEARLLAAGSVAKSGEPVNSATYGSGGDQYRPGRPGLTNVSGIVGTPVYMAPEQWEGQTLDARTDLYALGCIIYEMLAGRLAFWAPTLEGLREAHLAGPTPSLAPLLRPVAGISSDLSGLDELISCCLATDPAGRPVSASVLLEKLEALYEGAFGTGWRRLPERAAFTAADYTNRGLTYSQLSRYEEALRDYVRAIELEPNNAKIYSNRGATYQNLGRWEEALQDFDRAIQLDHNYTAAYSNRASTYHRLGRYEEALRDVNCALDIDPTCIAAYANRGLTYSDLKRYEEALRDYEQVIEIKPDEANAYYNRGGIYSDLGRYEEALRDYEQVIKIKPGDAAAYYNHGGICSNLSRYEEALQDFIHALQLDPNNSVAYCRRAGIYSNLGRYEEAIRDFSNAIQLEPNDAAYYASRGTAFQCLGRYEEALEDYDRAIEIEPNNIASYANRGNVYDSLDRYEEALQDYDRAIEIDGAEATVYYNRGNTYDSLGRYEEALKDFSRAIQLDPNDAAPYANRGNAYQSLGRYEEALKDFSRAIQLDPNNSISYVNRGSLYFILERYDEALRDFKYASALDPSDAEAHFNQGALLAKTDRLAEALQCFEHAAQLGIPEAAQAVVQVRSRLEHGLVSVSGPTLPPADAAPLRHMFDAFVAADSLPSMRAAARQFPQMTTDPRFLAGMEAFIEAKVSHEHQAGFRQRLRWLKGLVSP